MNRFRKDFPFFSGIDGGTISPLVYFDSAATSQRPQVVLDAINDFYVNKNANPLRGLYELSEKATYAYEHSREVIAKFLGAKEAEEIIFTRNASESLNLVAYSYGLWNLHEGDEIVVSFMEHHSNILPWQMVAKRTGAKVVYLEFDKETGKISDEELEKKITPKAKIVSITHISNVLGTENPVEKIGRIAHERGAVFVVDGAQGAPHVKVDVQKIGADFYAISGHKFGGPMGIGALYGRRDLLESMEPFLRGGEMIEYVTVDSATWAEVPHKFEAGTVNASGAVGMATAAEYIEKNVGYDFIRENDLALTKRILEGIKTIPHISLVGSKNAEDRNGIITFRVDGVHPHDVSTLLSSEGIAIRAGHHCAQPLKDYMGIDATARASLYFYNTEEEADKFLDKLAQLRSWSGYKD